MLTGFYWIISRWLDYDFVVSIMFIFRVYMYTCTYILCERMHIEYMQNIPILLSITYTHVSLRYNIYLTHYTVCIIQRSFVNLRVLDRPSYFIHPTVLYSQNVKTYVLVSTGLLSWIIDWIITRVLLF